MKIDEKRLDAMLHLPTKLDVKLGQSGNPQPLGDSEIFDSNPLMHNDDIFDEVCSSRGFGNSKFDEDVAKSAVDEELRPLDNS